MKQTDHFLRPEHQVVGTRSREGCYEPTDFRLMFLVGEMNGQVIKVLQLQFWS